MAAAAAEAASPALGKPASLDAVSVSGGGGGGGVSKEGGGRGSLLLLDDCHTNAEGGKEETHNKGDGGGGGFGRRINTNLSSGVGQNVCAFESCQRRLSPTVSQWLGENY